MISPQLATLVTQAPKGQNWLHEIKYDGYRLLCFYYQTKVKLITRGQEDWTSQFTVIQQALAKLKLDDAIFDGEVVALNDNHQADFQLLQNHLKAGQTSNLVYYIFDLLYYRGHDLTSYPLSERKQLLQSLLPKENPIIRYSAHIIGDGKTVFDQACKLGLEGIISKNAQSEYSQRRTRDWLKIKCTYRQEFVICGFTAPGGSRQYFGALILGVYKKGQLEYSGLVGTGFTNASLKDLNLTLKKYISTELPFNKRPALPKTVTWIEPKLVCEVEFTEWTREGLLRHPSFKGLRVDKAPKLIIREQPMPTSKSKSKIHSIRDDMRLTHPERIIYPEDNLTKQDLANYYEAIQDWILPYLSRRPLTLVRCPQGQTKACFFQKHLHDANIKNLYPKKVKEKNTTETYIYLKDCAGIMALVQMGVLEIHLWNAHIDKMEKPDMIIFDLDPSPEVSWGEVIATAKLIRSSLQTLKLKSFVKTTGGKGLHVVVPIEPKYSWEQVKEFAKTFTAALVATHPDRYIDTMSKAKRKGKIFIDYLRNQRGATSIAPYSSRARLHAPVATPLAWNELTNKIKPDSFTIKNLPQRLAKLKKDPWAEFFKTKQSISLQRKK